MAGDRRDGARQRGEAAIAARALIPGLHTKAYERRKPAKGTGRGLAGAFTQLLERHRELEQLIRQLILSREVLLIQKGTPMLDSRKCVGP